MPKREQPGQEELLEDLLDFRRLRPTEEAAFSYEEYLKTKGVSDVSDRNWRDSGRIPDLTGASS